MHLSPQEEAKARELVRKELEEAEEKKSEEVEKRKEFLEYKRAAEEKQRIIEEEQEKYYRGKGLEKYTTPLGATEWLTPEEIERRTEKIKKTVVKRGSGRRRRRKRRVLIRRIVGDMLLVLVVVGVLGILRTYMKSQEQQHRTGSLEVQSNIEGAAIFVDGKSTGKATNSVIRRVPVGKHIVTAVKPGYVTVPSQVEVDVQKEEVTEVSFTLVEDTD